MAGLNPDGLGRNRAYDDLESESHSTDEVYTRRINHTLATTPLGDGENIQLHQPFTAPSGASLKPIEVGVADEAGSTHTDLTLQVYDLDAGSVLWSTNADYDYGEPLNTLDVGGATIVIRVENTTGKVHDTGAEFDAVLDV